MTPEHLSLLGLKTSIKTASYATRQLRAASASYLAKSRQKDTPLAEAVACIRISDDLRIRAHTGWEDRRHQHLAYAFLRNRKYRQVEAKATIPPDANRIAALASAYLTDVSLSDLTSHVQTWLEGDFTRKTIQQDYGHILAVRQAEREAMLMFTMYASARRALSDKEARIRMLEDQIRQASLQLEVAKRERDQAEAQKETTWTKCEASQKALRSLQATKEAA